MLVVKLLEAACKTMNSSCKLGSHSGAMAVVYHDSDKVFPVWSKHFIVFS